MSKKTDPVANCLNHWVKTASGMHTPTWDEWGKDAEDALEDYNEQRGKAADLVNKAQWQLMDHNLLLVREHLDSLEELFGKKGSTDE